ncbi:hypothetical protein AKJ09_01064 [Labilithrix luteola]|uniref:Uncharacterized protein n=2 Tax=Labilithrix luteola TaxID=1391654 RepID=A0A0K1PLJ9_9BACT|nr:hypothetical protein AKJ09_01064 [Labilithrix luteola]
MHFDGTKLVIPGGSAATISIIDTAPSVDAGSDGAIPQHGIQYSLPSESGIQMVSSITGDDRYYYFTAEMDNKIGRIDKTLDPSSLVILSAEADRPRGIVAHDGVLYWIDAAYGSPSRKGSVRRMNVDGTDARVLVGGLTSPSALLLFENRLYYSADYRAPSSVDLDGGTPTTFAELADILTDVPHDYTWGLRGSFTVGAGAIYYVKTGGIYGVPVPKAGSIARRFATAAPYFVLSDDERVYWNENNRIAFAPRH